MKRVVLLLVPSTVKTLYVQNVKRTSQRKGVTLFEKSNFSFCLELTFPNGLL